MVEGGYAHIGMTTGDVSSYNNLRQDQRDIMNRIFNMGVADRGMYITLLTGYGKTYLLAVISQMANLAGTVVIVICPTRVSPHIKSVIKEMNIKMPIILHPKSINLINTRCRENGQ